MSYPPISEHCVHGHFTKSDPCPWCELESLRQENSRLREALGEIASDGEFIRDCSPMHLAMIANRALNPPKRS